MTIRDAPPPPPPASSFNKIPRLRPCQRACFLLFYYWCKKKVRPAQPVPDVDSLPGTTVRCLREAADVREAQHGHPVPHLLLPAGELPAVPRGARVEAAVVEVPQEVHDVVPGQCLRDGVVFFYSSRVVKALPVRASLGWCCSKCCCVYIF